MVGEQCVALHVVQLAVARVRQLRRRRRDVLRRIQAQQVVEPRLHLVASPIPVMTPSLDRCTLQLWRSGMAVSGSNVARVGLRYTSGQCMHCVAEGGMTGQLLRT